MRGEQQWMEGSLRVGGRGLLEAHGKSETGKVAVWKSESCCGHPGTVKCQGALKEQNITEILKGRWEQNRAYVLGCQKEKAPLFQEHMAWYPGIVSELRFC